jgi:aminoglycoside 6'-N-acetyltransferase
MTAEAGAMFDRLPFAAGTIRLRRLKNDDLAAFHAYRSDADVARFQGWAPMSMRQAAGFLAAEARHRQLVPGNWHQVAIASAGDDALIGDMGVWVSVDRLQAELGLSINPRHQGKGYGTQAVRALVHLLFSTTPVSEVIAHADIRNLPCLALLARSGMRYRSASTAEYKGEMCTEQLFGISRSEALASSGAEHATGTG